MVWDASKSPGDLITSSDWNDMVSDQKGHATRHSDGGSDELDAADLAGGLGTSGQVLQTDGSAVDWVSLSTKAFEEVADFASIPSNPETGKGFTTTDKGELFVEVSN